jgi:regulatory protein
MRVIAVAGDAARVRIEIAGHDDLLCSLETWLTSGFHVNAPVTQEDLARLREEEAFQRLKSRALQLLAARPRSRAELQRRLMRATPKRPAPDPALVERVLAKLEEAGLVDDRAFAEFWVEQRDHFRPKGSRALQAELARQGIRRDDSEAVVSPERDEERAMQAARPQAERLARRPDMDAAHFRALLGSFLARRGFGYETARGIIAALWREFGGEDDPDED